MSPRKPPTRWSGRRWQVLLGCILALLALACSTREDVRGEPSGALGGTGAGSKAATDGLIGRPESAVALIERSIRFHDPEGRWLLDTLELDQESSRPNGTGRTDSMTLAQGGQRFDLRTTREGKRVELEVGPDNAVSVLVDGKGVSEQVAKGLRLDPDSALRTRNYYVYLIGLPMKLRDPGTLIDPLVRTVDLDGRPVREVKVTYDPEVGTDTWYFQFDSDTAEMVGYHFFHDEATNDGEYIRLAGLESVGSLRLPRQRAWYRFEGDEYLGTDVLTAREDS